MKKTLTVSLITACVLLNSCIKKDENIVELQQKRTRIVSSNLDSTQYTNNFKDVSGDSTVDRTIGRKYNSLFLGLNAYIKTAVDSNKVLSETKIKNIFTNTNNEYTSTYSSLNSSGLQLKSTIATSFNTSEADKIRKDIEGFLTNLVASSSKIADTATNIKAGLMIAKNGKRYLVDSKGLEWGQIVPKALMGVYQLDYIGNVLLANINANNYNLVAGTNSTQLEQNWDLAYGALTQNNVYGSLVTLTTSGESQLGAYSWEYNPYFPKTTYCLTDIHKLFVKGRAAVVNNDKAGMTTYGNAIRITFEKSLANSALGYLGKWKTSTGIDDAVAAHALGEGLGFIYALRACKLSGGDVAFSDDIFNTIINTGYWNLTTAQVSEIEKKIKDKFKL